MKREHSLRQRLRSLETMSDAVSAMESLSAHHLRTTRGALPAAHGYLEQITAALAAADLPPTGSDITSPGLLVVAADLGLCGGYNSRIVQAALKQYAALHPARLYCVGRRGAGGMKRSDVAVDRQYRTPASVSGLTDLLLRLAQDLLEDYFTGCIRSLHVLSARFEGVGEFAPVCSRLLPIDAPQESDSLEPSPYVSRDHFTAIALREFLYIRLYQTLLDALASEHGTRLVATKSAGDWLSERIGQAQRQLRSIHREATTQEVLDVATVMRQRRRQR